MLLQKLMAKPPPPDGNLGTLRLSLVCKVLDAQSLTHRGSEWRTGWSLDQHKPQAEAGACSGSQVCHTPLGLAKAAAEGGSLNSPICRNTANYKASTCWFKKTSHRICRPLRETSGCPSVHDPYSLPAPLHGTGHSSQFGYFYFVGLGNLIKSRRVQTCNCPFPNWSFWNTWH